MSLSEVVLLIEDLDLVAFYGQNDQHLNAVRKAYPDVTITSRGGMIKLNGDKKRVQEVKRKLEMMTKLLRQYGELSKANIKDILSGENPFVTKIKKDSKNVIVHGRNGKPILPRTQNQKKMVDLSNDNDILFAIGPAGTGKTYTAVAMAVRALKLGMVSRIILTRPAVEAGENLGYLPGDLKDKIDPYLRPLYDALDDMIPPDKLALYMQNRVIEVAPLAFMRGRTLDNSFIILDEAQNTTETQLKMFLTRLGPHAKCIITGDLSQIDLPRRQQSGLIKSLRILKNIEGIGMLELTSSDVVRHRLVKQIIDAYEKHTPSTIKKEGSKTSSEKETEEGKPTEDSK
ncbi:PhoH family protein [Aureispira anguillae]|uniref:PhoH-like protein n=1 Tax=Aureispira anguillae TaxID=2864201 RepID=A0A916DPD0_9BACT|nr:PhoH family protein [Aureispira anguillae]BDS10071.1 PhoH family protein [Aureispira anguillae]